MENLNLSHESAQESLLLWEQMLKDWEREVELYQAGYDGPVGFGVVTLMLDKARQKVQFFKRRLDELEASPQ